MLLIPSFFFCLKINQFPFFFSSRETYRVVGFEVETQSIGFDKIKTNGDGSCTKNLVKGENNEQLIDPKSKKNSFYLSKNT